MPSLKPGETIPYSTKPAIPCMLRKVLQQAIIDTGLSYVEIAKRSGIHRSTLSAYMNDKRNGNIECWSDILEACGIEIGYRINVLQ